MSEQYKTSPDLLKQTKYLFHFMILSQQSIRAVGDTHGDDAHGADHRHGNIHVREDCHDSSSYGGKKEKNYKPLTFIIVFIYYCTVFIPIANASVPMM